MIDNDKQLRIMSYNSTGSNDDRLRYLNDASYGHDIILVQEHWLLSNNLKRIKTAVKVFTGFTNVDEAKIVLEGIGHVVAVSFYREQD